MPAAGAKNNRGKNKMNRVQTFLFCGVFLVSFGATGATPSALTCHNYSSKHLGKSVRYCYQRTRPESSVTNEATVFFFHGLNGDAETFRANGYSNALTQLSQEKERAPMTFVSFDTEGMSFFSDRANETTGGQSYESWFVKEFMPFIEKELPWTCMERECRATMGVSMGGYGALKTALKYPEFFNATAVNCPALAPFGIYESVDSWSNYFGRHPIGAFKGMLFLRHIRGIFTDRAQDEANDPSEIVKKGYSLQKHPALYFDMGGKDYFGFQEGYARFKNTLEEKALPFTTYFDPNEGHEIFKKTNKKAVEFLLDQFRGTVE